jgi:hypothetical protein
MAVAGAGSLSPKLRSSVNNEFGGVGVAIVESASSIIAASSEADACT